MTSFCAILLAAGISVRMGTNKLLIPIHGQTPLERSLLLMDGCGFDRIIVAVSPQTRNVAQELAARMSTRTLIVSGGASRQESVWKALEHAKEDVVLIHDAARCLASPSVIYAAMDSAARLGSGIAAIPVRDTLFRPGAGSVKREGIFATQTPQAFGHQSILAAYQSAQDQGFEATDDCMIYERAGFTPNFVKGCLINQKLTEPDDIPFFESVMDENRRRGRVRCGYGEDTHRLILGRKLILGGVDIPHESGLLGHSDADALIHAVMDALLGACGLGDIGRHFPDSDPKYSGASSLKLLEEVGAMVTRAQYRPYNIDAVIIAQAPKLSPYAGRMRVNIARALGMVTQAVNVKATTTEGMNAEGRMECVSARCVCAVEQV